MSTQLRLPAALIALLLLTPLPQQTWAQDYGLETEIVSDDIGVLVGALGVTDLTGYSTTRVYATTTNPNDFVSSVSGDATNPTLINTTTEFFHNILGAGVPNGINSFLFSIYPDLLYDSWVSIGLESSPDLLGGEANISTVQSGENPWFTNFDPGGGLAGGNIAIDDPIGGAWYALNGDANGIAGDDLKVLVGQFTTTGEISGQLYVQFFIEGDGGNEFRDTFFIGGSDGCTDEDACNYDSAATSDDGSCAYAEAGLDCDGNCLADADGDGICDGDEIEGCTDATACNYSADATDDNGSCTFAGAGLDCDGNCLADADGDGICDGDEIEGCTDEEANNFDPNATDDDGSCQFGCQPEWGNPITYPSVATVLAMVTVEGENANIGDEVAAFVGGELRGTGEIIEFESATYINMTVSISGGEETIEFLFFNQMECSTCSMDAEVTAMSFGEYGSFDDPLMFDANCSATALEVNLTEGWNYVSTNITPENYAISSLFEDALGNSLLKVLGDDAFALSSSYTPGIPSVFNSLQMHSDAAGYVIKMEEDGIWSSNGLPLDATSVPLDLNEGWNIIGYVPQASMTVANALNSIDGLIATVIDGQNGTVWNPANDDAFNSLQDMEPGRAYWIRMLESGTLTYPDANPEDGPGMGIGGLRADGDAAQDMTGWTVVRSPFASALAAESRLDDQPVDGEAYIGAFVNETCVAARPVIAVNNITAAQMAIMLESAADVTFRLWVDGQEFSSEDMFNLQGGEELGQAGDVLPILRFGSAANAVIESELISEFSISPMPARNTAWMNLNLNKESQMRIAVLDARGAEIALLHDGQIASGQHRMAIEVGNWAAGTYFVRGEGPNGMFRSPLIVH